jgi:hypothetical protein
MKKIFTKKWWIGLISIPFIAGGIALACAGGWEEEYGTSNFTPEVFVDSAYRPFFYSEMFYYNIGHDINHDKRFNETIVAEWNNWFENKASTADLEYLLVHEGAETIDSAADFFAGKLKQLPPSLRGMKLLANKSTKTQDFITYLSLAKKCEAFALNNFESEWDYQENKKPARFNASKVNPALLQGFNNTKGIFLKQRYWFQLVRSHFFNTTPQNAIDAFEANKNNFQKNKLFYRTMAYAAGAYYKQKNYSKANYYYSRVYDGCDELKTVAHYSFHPQEEKDWKATLALAQNKDEQATLWQMLGVFYEDEKRAINEIHKLDPQSEKLDLLLARAINKEEQKFYAWRSNLEKSSLNLTNEALDQELVLMVNRIATSPNTGKPYMWHMAAGYLSTLKNDFTKAQSQYTLAEKSLPKNNRHQSQLRLLKFMNKLAAANRIDSKFENEILSEINWLANFESQNFPEFRHADAYNWMRQHLAYRYRSQKELLKAECFFSNPSFYASNNNVEAMKAFIDKPSKSPYEELCAKLYVMKKSDLLEYQGVRLTYEDKIADAIIKMETGTNANKELLGNPFNGRINDCHDCDHAAPQKIKYTKLALLKKMKEMQDKVSAGDDVYNNSMLLANAFYNITHYGNARYFYEGAIIGGGQYSPFTIDSVFEGFITDMKLASKYYNKALQAAKTDEQKAKCHYMLAKCERNQWYNETFFSNRENEYSYNNPKGDFKAWAGFKALKQYSNTQYYKDVIKECGYFRTYTSK